MQPQLITDKRDQLLAVGTQAAVVAGAPDELGTARIAVGVEGVPEAGDDATGAGTFDRARGTDAIDLRQQCLDQLGGAAVPSA